MSFDTPATPSSGVKWAEHLGALVIFDVKAVETGIPTTFGDTDAVRADVTFIDGDTHPDTLIFPKILQSQLRPKVGSKVLGRIGQGTAKPGQSAPWILTDPTPDDITRATQFEATAEEPF
jgi:hypothetical protein